MNAIIYARFSPRPNGHTCESIELQVDRCRAYCALQGHAVSAVFDDRELSGARADNRPGLQAALKAACEQKAVVVAYSLSRLARSVRDALAISDLLQKAGAHMALLDLAVDTTTATGRAVYTILAAVAELERGLTVERTKDALARRRDDGRRISHQPPYGYAFDGKRVVVLPVEQETITFIRSLNGAPLRQVRQALSEKGFTCRGQRWYAKTLRRLISQPDSR